MNNSSKNDDEVSLKELLGKLKEWFDYLLLKWKVIVLVGIIGAILGLTFSFIKKPNYTASLSFALEESGSSGGGLGGALGLASQFGFDVGDSSGGMFAGANLTEVFKSRSMVEKTLYTSVKIGGKTTSLAEIFIKENGWREKMDEDPKLKNIHFIKKMKPNDNSLRAQDSILGLIYKDLLKKNLRVEQKDKKVSIIDIDMISTNELFSKLFAESLAKVVSDFYIDTKSKKARMNMDILERQTDSIRAELNGAITGVAVANDNTFNLNPALNIRRTPSVKRQVDVQANGAILTELVKQTELAKVTLRRETPLIQIIDSPILPLANDQLSKLSGLFIGGLLGGFLTVFFLIAKRVLQSFID
ncbi:lipopolysaccharide biosynthesis protein [Flavobacterium sp. GA093]|uniref:Lipopolysaccharide biosynthesis protein n=1 Tax=Flavobacterium hydrocarbonoxydans TaxID=2683249 RepID=A0A6I4NKE8_9FLAO|nr:Wzz/FepE/Etk N-terminal domain-containing protein [Flavobacterium hydrocarbonoxydans]MWB94483.1 lipopolysaccharide biosynthesis protein [Flavobacterium hydrocarbonoxydans]